MGKRLFQLTKGILVASTLATYVAFSYLSVLIPNRQAARRFRLANLSFWCRIILKFMGVKVTDDPNSARPAKGSAHLIVSNHLSYVDVLAIASRMPAVFVTSVEVRDTPVLGTLCRAGGSLFVERRSRTWLLDEIKTIAQDLEAGFNVVVFPEGTTSAGNQVLPFKKSLLGAARAAKVDLLPICLNYDKINGQRPDKAVVDSVFYYGDMEFFPHLQRLLALRSVEVRVTTLEPIQVTEDVTRRDLSERAYHSINANYQPISV